MSRVCVKGMQTGKIERWWTNESTFPMQLWHAAKWEIGRTSFQTLCCRLHVRLWNISAAVWWRAGQLSKASVINTKVHKQVKLFLRWESRNLELQLLNVLLHCPLCLCFVLTIEMIDKNCTRWQQRTKIKNKKKFLRVSQKVCKLTL